MRGMEKAKNILEERNLSLVILKRGEIIFESESRGVQGLLDAIEDDSIDVEGTSVADRVVGRGAAFLLAYMGVDSLFGEVISKPAMDVLEENNIRYDSEEVVKNIQNRDGSDICPFEKLTSDIDDPEIAYREIKELAASFSDG